ncbi:MAG: HPr(Ser) kinase/phosphatase [Gemmatimonadetes bacterium]|nr:HPr(Ser) kinase/phosphatase [Gemmatimonadota bacterium]MYA65262.1 HPr(Ser) kinase/phosphatase [Gemmatimonadota bacterium]MYB99790.1 HPr(Ser) kinase/phosphatase [Gemmatimonadota bacterium]MYH53653.1 HPr(Ser) kinase/phosphatase [Gemmatimonadota bacterium]MYI45014.1 HPr(Ser) kinase/phosphatase [Gemmatimonadota bacterium]
MSAFVTVRELLDAREASLHLELLTPRVPLEGRIVNPDVSSPGLSLAGYTDRFPEGRTQVFGKTEMSYLSTLKPGEVEERLGAVFAHDVPAVFVTRGQKVPDAFLAAAERARVPVLRTRIETGDFYRALKPYLEDVLAPVTTVHGSLADVYGIGLLFTGPSGIGKSECVLGLVQRGHRLVADDLVFVSRRGNDVLMGKGHERQGFHMEIRGIGIVDVASMFGTRATRQRKRVEVIVDLQSWDDSREYDRTGLDREMVRILDVEIPRLTIPLNPGKNLIAISEVIAMNQLLAYSGVDVPRRFDDGLRGAMNPRDSLIEDYE